MSMLTLSIETTGTGQEQAKARDAVQYGVGGGANS